MPIAKVNGIKINYRVEGEGEPLVMIMGFSGRRSLWMLQTPAFKKQYRVVTFDNRGIGKSDKPPAPYSTRVMAEDTIALMDHLGIQKAHILGVSMGGMIAQEIAINHPERVMKLVLVATYACRDNESNGLTTEMDELMKLPVKAGTSRLVTAALNSLLLKATVGLLAKVQLALMGKPETVGLIGQMEACLAHSELDRLPKIALPTLVMVGTGDRVIKPSSSDVIARCIPGAKLTKFENGSHMFCADMSGRFNKEVLTFLKNG